MAISNEELMEKMHRASRIMNRGHGGHKGHGHGPHGHKHHCSCHEHGPRPEGAGPHDGPNPDGRKGGPRPHGCERHGQNRVLACLALGDGIRQKELAYLLGIRPQSLSQMLGGLEADGFIERKPNEADKRVLNVYLTEAGRERAVKAAEDRKTRASELDALSDEEKEQLAAILDKLFSAFEEERAKRCAERKQAEADAAK